MTDFGRDIACTDSLRTGRYATGLRVVAEALYRRLITRRGELLDDPDYGLPLSDYLGSVVTAADIARAPGLIRQELLKDPRVSTVDVEFTDVLGAGNERSWTVQIEAYTDAGPFELTLSVGAVTTALVGFSE